MRRLPRAFLLLGCFMLAPALARAQATLAGVVRDTSGAVLPGVTVETSSPVLIEKVRTAVSDGTGQYRFTDLPPGGYVVTFKLAGFGWFTYAALAPGTYSSLPPVPDYPLPYWSRGASVAAASADGRTLTLQFGTSTCAIGWGGLVYETSAAVVVGSWSKVSGTICNLALASREATVHLAQPLGSRVVLDAGTALPVAPK